MATRNPLARGKRERERARAEKQKEKAARRSEARARRGQNPGIPAGSTLILLVSFRARKPTLGVTKNYPRRTSRKRQKRSSSAISASSPPVPKQSISDNPR